MKKLKFFDDDEDDEIPNIAYDELSHGDEHLANLESLESQMRKGKLVECKYCDGTGKVVRSGNVGILAIGTHERKPCPSCGGSGYQRV